MKSEMKNIYQIDGKVPVLKAVPFGLQHILAMFVANIAPIIIVGGACGLSAEQSAMLIQNAMIIAGIGTLIQLFKNFLHLLFMVRVGGTDKLIVRRLHQVPDFLNLSRHSVVLASQRLINTFCWFPPLRVPVVCDIPVTFAASFFT